MTDSGEERMALARRGFEAYDAGDIEVVLGSFDPGIEVNMVEAPLNAGTYDGHDGFLRWAQQWNEAWDDFRNQLNEISAVGERHVIAEIVQSGRGRGSGVEVEMTVGYVFEYRDGLCTYLAMHPTLEEAWAAAREREGLPAATEGD